MVLCWSNHGNLIDLLQDRMCFVVRLKQYVAAAARLQEMPERCWRILMLSLALVPEVTPIWDAEGLTIASHSTRLSSLFLWPGFGWNCEMSLLSHAGSAAFLLNVSIYSPEAKTCVGFSLNSDSKTLDFLFLSRCGRVCWCPGQLQYGCHLSEHPQVIQMHLQIRIQRRREALWRWETLTEKWRCKNMQDKWGQNTNAWLL